MKILCRPLIAYKWIICSDSPAQEAKPLAYHISGQQFYASNDTNLI